MQNTLQVSRDQAPRYLGDGVNRDKLRTAMKVREKTQTAIAKTYGKSLACISDKLNGRAPFNAGDIQFFYAYLNLSSAEATAIFFGKSTL